jgi:hypothetical protein
MKLKTTLLYFLKAALGAAILNFQAPEAAAQTVTYSKPGNSQDYDHNGTTWVHVSNSKYFYNSAGKLTSKQSKDPNTNLDLTKTEITYDTIGNQTSYLDYQWQNNAWSLVSGGHDSLVYDAHYNILVTFNKYLNNGVLEREKMENTYDANDHKIEEVRSKWINGAWVPIDRTLTTFANGLITDIIRQIYQGSAWKNSEKETHSGWNIPNVRPASFIQYTFNQASNQWVPATRSNITLTTNGGYVTIIELFQNNAWVNSNRWTAYYNTRGNFTGYLSEMFTNGAWTYFFENQFLFTYNSTFDITEKISRWPNTQVAPSVDQHKAVYSTFQYFTRVLGTSEVQDANLTVSIFPNPAQDILHIDLAENANSLQKATITDLTGKTVLNQTFKAAGQNQLNVAKLPAGIYLLNLETEKGNVVKKFVKQ